MSSKWEELQTQKRKFILARTESLGERIKDIRLLKGLTMQKFGALINGADRSLVSKWERNLIVPGPERLKSIARIGNVSLDELIGTTKKVQSIHVSKETVYRFE